MAEATDVIQKYADSQGLSILEARQKLQKINEDFNDLYVDGVFSSSHTDKLAAHRSMGSAFKNDPVLFRAFDQFRHTNGEDRVKESLKSADNGFGVGNIIRSMRDSVEGTNYENNAEAAMMDAYGFTQGADGSWSEPWTAKKGMEAASNAVKNATPQSDAEIEAAKKKAEAEAAALKTLDQPEGGAASDGVSNTPANRTQANLQAKINSMPEDVALGSGGATKKSRSRMNLQAEADRQAADIIKQQRKQSDQNNFLRDRYDATGGRGVGAFDSLSPDAKAQAIKNYSTNSFFDSSTQAGKDQEALFYKNNPNYTPPKADIQSQYEAASMNPPSVASADGTATTAEFGAMNPAQQRAFIQNYKYKPQGQTPETVQEGLMGNAMISSNPLDNIGTNTLTPFMTGEEQDDIVTQSLGSPKTENLSPFIPGSFPNSQSVAAAEKQSALPSALRQQAPYTPLPKPQYDQSQGLLNLANPSQVLPPQQFADQIAQNQSKPAPQISNEFDVSKLPVLEEVQTTENEIPDFSNVPSTAPAPQPGLTRPQGMPPREEGFEEFLKPDPPQAKPKGQSPVYGKKPDGTFGITGYRNLADMKTGAYTPTMANNERRADQQKRARSGEMSNPFADLGSTYNRYADGNEDAFAKRRAQQAELAKKAARQRELAAMPTPRADAGMDLMNSLPMNQQVGIVNQFRKKRGEQDIFNPYSA
jgi:hypothetical protein